MEAFTDDDLKRLKESMDSGGWTQWMNRDKFEALLARLEAAEAVCKYELRMNPELLGSRANIPLLKAWLKECGR
jgi:hypothetical protein